MLTATSITRYGLAWTPFFVLWVLFLLAFTSEDVGSVLLSGLTSTVSAAIPGLAIWALTERLPWPDKLTARLVLSHLALAIPFAVWWAASAYVFDAFGMDRPILEAIMTSETFRWRVLMGLWLYAIVAGVSYAIRNRDRLREQERIAARAEAVALEARLAALRNQLNPHFLFNALHSVNALIRTDPDRAELAVERLADLLRYTLDGANTGLVSLGEEWAFTEGYLALQKIRFGDRLRFESRFEDGTLSHLVPPFILQPLVENAVEHGISSRVEGGEVRISAELKTGNLILVVEDDGPSARTASSANGHGTGLAVLRERLEARFGDRADLEVTDHSGVFVAAVSLPTSMES